MNRYEKFIKELIKLTKNNKLEWEYNICPTITSITCNINKIEVCLWYENSKLSIGIANLESLDYQSFYTDVYIDNKILSELYSVLDYKYSKTRLVYKIDWFLKNGSYEEEKNKDIEEDLKDTSL